MWNVKQGACTWLEASGQIQFLECFSTHTGICQQQNSLLTCIFLLQKNLNVTTWVLLHRMGMYQLGIEYRMHQSKSGHS